MSDKPSVEIDLNPQKVIDSLNDMGEETMSLADKIEAALGKGAAGSIAKLEDAAERGTTKISGFFRNLGTRVKEDMKSAFDVGKLLSGIKIAENIAQGTRQIFDMERAFDRLNTRLGLSNTQMIAFKKNVGQKVAGTGQKLEDVLPGVESAAARGNIKSPQQLGEIAQALGQAKATTGEDTGSLSETVTEILKSQGIKITGDTFKKTLDALQATRVKGSFQTAGEAGQAIEKLSPYAKQLGMGTRQLGGLAAMAGKSGAGGQNILEQLMKSATEIGGASRLNATLGQKVFKEGKQGQAVGMNAEALGKVNMQSPQVMEAITGLTGASGGDLKRFVDSFKSGMDDFQGVVSGADETASQFGVATDNLASKIDKFKENAKESGREIGESFSQLGKDLLGGKVSKLGDDVKNIGKTGMENKGTLLASLGIAGAGALMAGSGMKGLLSKIPGAGGMLGGVVAGEAAKAAGITPVYVTNAKDIGASGGSMVDDFLKKTADMAGAGKGAGLLSKFGGLAMGAGGVAAAGAGGYAIGMGINKVDEMTGNHMGDAIQGLINKAVKASGGQGIMTNEEAMAAGSSQAQNQSMDPALIALAVEKGTHAGTLKAKGAQRPIYTNPSAITGRGPSQ